MTGIKVYQEDNSFHLIHPQMKIEVDVSSGTWSLFRTSDGLCLLREAGFRLDHRGQGNWKEAECERSCGVAEVNSKWGLGTELTLSHAPVQGYAPISRLHITLYADQSFVELDWSVENQRSHVIRVRDFDLLYKGGLFPGGRLANPQYLAGGAGAKSNLVESGEHFECFNNALLTAKRGGERLNLVAGGLNYEHYLRGVEVLDGERRWGARGQALIKGEKGRFLTIYAEDPTGHLVEPEEVYRPGDSSYLDLLSCDPFEALECYGYALAKANGAEPNAYNFPTLCGWMVSTKNLGEGKPINHSTALIEQAKIAKERGWMDVVPLGVRLEPDYYCDSNFGDTQQGWWDDEHFKKYGALSDGAPTFKSFCEGLEEQGAIPFTYVQSSMPSNDFALKRPEWMLRGDVSDLHRHHFHHRPHIRYDFSHPGLQEHLLGVWQRLAEAGLKGIKFDYPETAWNTEGGYSENFTSTQAYKKLFEICKEGLGEDSYVHERNLGGLTHENAPCLDVTAGTVDLQRVWGDASHFEPEMATIMGLRWYKCRRVFHYYPDGKSFFRDGDALPAYERRSFLTLIGLLGGRIEIGTSIGTMNDEMFKDLSKLYPTLEGNQSFRPVDFLVTPFHPEVYLYRIDNDSHQVILFNGRDEDGQISTSVSGDPAEEGGLGLDSAQDYHAFSFWRQEYLGCLKGSDILSMELKSGEAEVISVRRVIQAPQLISTDRHVMQGMLECHNLSWEGKILRGEVDLLPNTPLKLTVCLQWPSTGPSRGGGGGEN